MKKVYKILLSSILVLIGIFALWGSSLRTDSKIEIKENQVQNYYNKVLIGAAGNYRDLTFKYISSVLGFNFWHNYVPNYEISGKHYPDGWTFCTPNDKLFSHIDDYKVDVSNKLLEIGAHNMNSWMQRSKIEFLCYGQRSDYKCVDTQYVDKDLWFYTFQSPNSVGLDIQDLSSFGNGNYVRYCGSNFSNRRNKPSQSPGIVVSRLKTNGEQSHRGTGYDGYRWDSEHSWFVKPKIRIDKEYALQNPEAEVCRITVIGQDGVNQLLNVVLKCKNFYDLEGKYDGNYVDTYSNLNESDSLIIHGDWGDKWLFSARGNKIADTDNNRSDIQVYWYGKCEMWIEHVRVDNDIANDLLSNDKTNSAYNEYMNWLEWEAKIIACQSGDSPIKFYLELMEFNQIPCVSFINKKLDSICTKGVDLVIAPVFYQYHMSWEDRGKILKPDQIKRQFVDRVGISQLLYGHLPFTSIENVEDTYSLIPETLPISTGNRILAKSVHPDDYEAWLQANLDTLSDIDDGVQDMGNSSSNTIKEYFGSLSGSGPCPQMPQFEGKYRFDLELANKISKLTNVPFLSWVQVTQWFTRCSEIEREPTSEELDLITNLPIAYGSKGVFFYEYGGWSSGEDYSYAFTESDGYTPRINNVYGQPKWSKLIKIIERLKKWDRYISNFDNTYTSTFIYRFESDRTRLVASTYIKSMKSLVPFENNNFQKEGKQADALVSFIEETPNKTYLQVSTFRTINDQSLYFMVVNKRCSPIVDNSSIINFGGKRKIECMFNIDNQELQNTRSWKVFDIDSPDSVIIIDLTKQQNIELGYFLPGEGRIFSISPLNETAPVKFNLSQNYPNPFNPTTVIKYSLPSFTKVILKVYDMSGREVQTLVNRNEFSGNYEITFDASGLSSGVYFYTLQTNESYIAKKMVFLK